MKTILGLDLGTTSIGWAVVQEGDSSAILKTGVRIVPLSTEEENNFKTGKSITTNADRRLKRSARRNLQRYKLRRKALIEGLKEFGLISDQTILCESLPGSTFETYRLRAKAVVERIELEELARVFLMLNKKRGYKSSRKLKNEDDGQSVDSIDIAKTLYDRQITPGQLLKEWVAAGKKNLPDFYPSDLSAEFDQIWNTQAAFYPDIFLPDQKEKLFSKSRLDIDKWAKERGIEAIELKGKLIDKKYARIDLRAAAATQQISLGACIEVFKNINTELKSTSGLLGSISDRSKRLYMNQQTIGQYLFDGLSKNPHYIVKGQTFYRQDYLDEFERIWQTQAKYHPVLTPECKKVLRDVVIFYQRKLKSQKGILSVCELEGKVQEKYIDGRKKSFLAGPKVIPRSSPLFQEFKIWDQLNNVRVGGKGNQREKSKLSLEEMQLLHHELTWAERLSPERANKILGTAYAFNNVKQFQGNRTLAQLLSSYLEIAHASGHEVDLTNLPASEKIQTLHAIFQTLGIDVALLRFDPNLTGDALVEQPIFKLWHLLYSYEGDGSKSGIEGLLLILEQRYGFEKNYGKIIARTSLDDDYGSLSSKAIQKILPYLREGNGFDIAESLAGYRSRTESKDIPLVNRIELLPKNSLRNPVVEKILNQMIHVVNGVVDQYGKPDVIRIELARELKKNAEERENLTKMNAEAEREHLRIAKVLKEQFYISNPSRNDIIRYKLYEELKDNAYRTLYSNRYIEPKDLFSPDIDIEHIIPQAKLFDDSFSNKTLEFRDVNLKKKDSTAYDFVASEYGAEALAQYEERVKRLFNREGKRTKYRKLLWKEEDLPEDFLNRDLQNTRYISKKAKDILSHLVAKVEVTSGSITQKLREDWQLVDVLEELNRPKYQALGLVETIENRHGQKKVKIKDWTKRNDHRHHVMDAITVAFTKPSYIQYLNNLNARSNTNSILDAIQKKEITYNKNQKWMFRPPIPLDEFRAMAKAHLESTLVSFKAKNKVTTLNKNRYKKGNNQAIQITQTPRGGLHNETVYGLSLFYHTQMEKVGSSFTEEKIAGVAKKKYRDALRQRLHEFGGDPKKAFTGKNAPDKRPIYTNPDHTEEVPGVVKWVSLMPQYTQRKKIDSKLNLKEVIDGKVKTLLQERLDQHQGSAEKAFSNLEDNPIYLNKEKGLILKTVRVKLGMEGVALHTKKDHFGREILTKEGKPIPTGHVQTAGNHHIAIYMDDQGQFIEEVVTFMEAVTRKNLQQPVIRTQHESGAKLLMTLKRNEYFVFPHPEADFNPLDIDLLDPANKARISPHLFRVQNLSSKYFVFRHHLETTLDSENQTKDLTWKRVRSLKNMQGLIKVRLNALGDIVEVLTHQ